MSEITPSSGSSATSSVASPLRRGLRGERAADLGALGVAAVALSFLYAIRIHSADTWWHLATGRWIHENGAIPTTDPFGFVTRGEPWVYVDWLPEWVLYAVWQLGGFGGLVVLKMALAGLLLAGVGAACRAAGAGRAASIAAMCVVAVLAQPRYAMLRPNLFGAALLSWTMALVLTWGGASERPGARLPAATLLLLPLVALLWMPTHGSAILALALGGVALVGAGVGVFVDRPHRARRARFVAAAIVACGVTFALFLAVPAGRHILHVVTALDTGGMGLRMTVEWRSTDVSQPQTWMPLLWTALGVLFALVRWRRHTMALGIALGGAWLARGYERNLAEAVVMASPAAALALDALARRADRAGMSLAAGLAAPAVALLICAGHFGVAPERALNERFGFGTDESRYPHDTLPLLRELPEGRTINSFGIGGYLIWQQIPGGVFSDGRTVAVYTDAIFDEHILPTMQDTEGLDAVADRFDVRYGLASFGSLQFRVMMTSPTWMPVMHGESTTLFVRRRHAGAVAATGRPILNELRWDEEPGWNERWYRGVLAAPEGREALVRALEVSAGEAPDNPVLVRVVSVLRALDPTVLSEVGAGR